MKNIVVIGGGHGQSIILKGIKDIADINISAIVTVADNGGSTGRIRELYTIPAMGDIRNVLIALSDEELLSELMNFRFEGKSENDIIGHVLGNLILTALTQMTDSFSESIDIVSDLLHVKGKIIPSSLEALSLYALMDDDTIVKGEAAIPSHTHHILEVFYDHEVKANPLAVESILAADIIIYGIGSLYTSIAPNIIIPEIRSAIKESNAKKIYFANCMTQSNETFNYDLKDHIDALIKHGALVDLVIKHNEEIPGEIKEKYLLQNSIEVIDNGNLDIPVLKRNMLDFSDGLVRHSPEKISTLIKEFI